jgi:hypothetical protein
VSELRNAKLEAFAEAVAGGASYVAASVAAGFGPDRGNASRRAKSTKVRARIAELRAEMPPPEAVPEAVPVADGIEDGGGRLAQLRRLREAGVANRQINAAVAAEREAIRHEREQTKAKGKDINLVALAQSLIPYLRWALNRRGTTPEELACRMLGIVDPTHLAALGMKPKSNGHTRPAA